MSLFLIRHGETSLNLSRVIQPAHTPLSERGHAQAAALAQRLAKSGLVGIVSSDLARARQTAEHLAQACALPLTTTALLQERNFGDLRGQAYDQLGIDPLKLDAAPPGGESMQQFLQRAAAAFAHVITLQASIGGPLAVVSHGLVVAAMLHRHARLGTGQLVPSRLRNSSLSIVDSRPPHQIRIFDDTTHLDANLAGPQNSLAGA